MTPRPEDVALPVCPKCGSELRRVLDRRGGWTCTSLRCEKFGQFIKELAVHRPAPEDVALNTLESAGPNSLEPDVALLNEVADSLVAQYHGYVDRFKGSKLHAASLLRALASRLEGEGRDGERLAEAVLDLWDSRPAVIANDAEYFAHTARQDAKREKVLELARAIAPASCNQPTTTTEEHVP